MNLQSITDIAATINSYAWGIPSIVLLIGTGIYLTLRLGFIQVRGFKQGFIALFGKTDGKHKGDISRFGALSTALSGTIGTGNIAGVATAITLGGPGALFWMWMTALFGMATKYAECTLAIKYRQILPNGLVSGGPMYTLKYGLRMPKLAIAFALFTLLASFGIGSTVQANSIVGGLHYIIPGAEEHTWIIAITLALLVGVVIIGGVKRIAMVASLIVPFMALAYCLFAVLILAMNIGEIPAAIMKIINLALNPAAAGGAAVGAAIQYGVARGVFSNEAGLGSAAIAHAAARTEDPVRQGLVAMLGPFIDTLIICTMTGLVIVITMGNGMDGFEGAALSAHAFERGLVPLGIGQFGSWIVGLGLVFFAYSTMIAWSYYGDRCVQFVFGINATMPYRIVFILSIMIGALAPLQLVWSLADIANILMALPNLLSIILLASVLKKLTRNHL